MRFVEISRLGGNKYLGRVHVSRDGGSRQVESTVPFGEADPQEL